MAEPSFEIPTTETAEKRLESWKEIAAYLSRDVSTVQRWEKKEGMPVHRHLHDKRGSVYALPEELDAWRSRRQPSGEPEIQPRTETPVARITEPPTRAPKGWLWTAIGVVALLVLIGAYFVFHHRRANQSPPGIRSLAVLPLRNLSGDPCAGLSRRRHNRGSHRTRCLDSRSACDLPYLTHAVQKSANLCS